MDKEFTITKITKTEDSKFPDSKKYTFNVAEQPESLSTFSKFPMTAGQSIYGHVEVNGNFHNFKWGKKGGTPVGSDKLNQLETLLRKMDFKLDSIIRSMKVKFDGETSPVDRFGITEDSSTMKDAFEDSPF